MLRVKLPTWEKHFNEEAETVTITDRDIEVEINTTVFAEQRWEELYPQMAKSETLFNYISRLTKSDQVNTANVISSLKALFCFIESDEIADFKAFCRLFDLSDVERLKKLVTKIKTVFNLVLSSSAVDSKN